MKITLKDIILVGLIIILSLALLFKKDKFKQVQKVIENTTRIDSLLNAERVKADSISILKNAVLDLERYNEKIEIKLKQNDLTLQKIKNEYNKKDSVINFYNVTELEQFFSNRYGQGN